MVNYFYWKKENDKNIGVCKCGFKKQLDSDAIFVEKQKLDKTKGINIISSENKFATFPHKCEKCGYDKAELIDLGVKVSDESNIMIFKCGKCGHTERFSEGSNA